MCKHKRRSKRNERYEGPTIQLGSELAVSHASNRCMRSPWHLLWLIWPLTMLIKWLVPTLLVLWTTLATRMVVVVNAQTMLAMVLIGVGLVLVLRSRRNDEHPYD